MLQQLAFNKIHNRKQQNCQIHNSGVCKTTSTPNSFETSYPDMFDVKNFYIKQCNSNGYELIEA